MSMHNANRKHGIARWNIVFAMGLAVCAAVDSNAEAPSLDGTAWVLASLPDRVLVPGAIPTARFEAGQVTGNDGCNRYLMPFTGQGNEIAIGPLGPSTMMACAEDTMAQAGVFISALHAARGYRIDAGSLELLDANGAVVATFIAQADSLAGTSWNVLNINNGRQAVVGVVAGSSVTMEFDAEGRVSGATGCNRFTAAYHIEGDSLRPSNVAVTRRTCADPEIDEQEQAFLRILESVVILRFEGNILELRLPDGALALLLEREIHVDSSK